MYAKTITYTDYSGNERTETFYFNLTQTELVKMETSIDGGMKELLTKIVAANDTKNIMKYFDIIVMHAYGEKSPDGRRFIKSKELSEAFMQTEAYNKFFMEFINNPKTAADFINNVIPEIKAPTVPAAASAVA